MRRYTQNTKIFNYYLRSGPARCQYNQPLIGNLSSPNLQQVLLGRVSEERICTRLYAPFEMIFYMPHLV